MNEESVYRNYIADAFFYQGQNKTHARRYIDLIRQAKNNKDAQDVVDEIVEKCGLNLVRKEDADADI